MDKHEIRPRMQTGKENEGLRGDTLEQNAEGDLLGEKNGKF